MRPERLGADDCFSISFLIAQNPITGSGRIEASCHNAAVQRFLVVWRIAASPIFSRAKETVVQNKELYGFADWNMAACAGNAEMLQCTINNISLYTP